MDSDSRPWKALPAANLAPWLIVIAALAMRAYRLAEYSVFLNDQGVDALVARRLVLEGVVPVEGPITSAGGVHLAPLYYFLLALPMVVFGFDPLWQAALMVVLGTAAVALLYWLTDLWFGWLAAIVAASLFAVSPALIVVSRSAWNPSPAPFFLLLALFGLALARKRADGRWLLATAFGLGCLIQLHYFTVMVVLVVAGFAIREAVRLRAFAWALLGVLVFAVLLAPFLVHELRDGFPNLQAASRLAGAAPTTTPVSPPRRLYEVFVAGMVGSFLTGGIEMLAVLVAVGLLAGLAIRRSYASLLLMAMLAGTLVLAVVYRGPIFQHYFLPLSPLLFLAMGALTAVAARFSAVVAVALIGLNVWQTPLMAEPFDHFARTEVVARAIAERAAGAPFATWLLRGDDGDGAYRYQLARLSGIAPARPDEPLPKQLFVLCQDSPCTPEQAREAAGSDWSTSTLVWQSAARGVSVLQFVRDDEP